MNRLQLALLAGLCFSAAVTAVVRAVAPPVPSLGAYRRRLYGQVNGPTTATRAGWFRRLTRRLGEMLSATSAGEWLALQYGDELRDTSWTVPDLLTRVVTGGALGFLSGSLGLASAGALTGSAWAVPAVVVGLFCGLIGVLWVWSDWQSKARRSRALWDTAVTDYIQLVAVCLTTDRSAEEAVAYAAEVGAGSAFDVIRHNLASAPLMGRSAWEALDAVGANYRSNSLRDLASSIQRQSTVGVAVDQTVAALAQDLRQRSLYRLQRDADRANSTLIGPTTLFVLGVLLFLAYPLAMRVSSAFTG
jgi:hypothetical protein